MKFAVIRESSSRVRILAEKRASEYNIFEYKPMQMIGHINNTDGIALIVTPTGDGVDRISFVRIPEFKGVSEEQLADLILTHLKNKGFDIDKIDSCVYDTNLDSVMSAVAVQYGYYDEYAGIAIE